MSFDEHDERWLASLDPVDRDELTELLDQVDLPARIMALPAEPAKGPLLVRLGRSIETNLSGWMHGRRPSYGRAAFAATVSALVIAAAVAVDLIPGSLDEQQAGQAGGEPPLDATTTSPPTMPTSATTSPEHGAITVEASGSETTEGRISATATEATPNPADPAPSSTTDGPDPGASSTTSDTGKTSLAGPSTTRHPTTTTRPPTTVATTPSSVSSSAQPTTTARQPGPTNGRFDRGRDLLALHYDHVIYRDDGHATVAAREIVNDLGIAPVVVGGTYSATNTRYNADSEVVMNTTWGPNGWLNAHANRTGAVAAAAQRWTEAIADGNEVWVAEGGQSDYTADVIMAVAASLPSVDLGNRIHVVQHSVANERRTSPNDLAYLFATIDYIKIDDGNEDNATANLNRFDEDFIEAALDGPFASAWSEAFNYLDPYPNLDFSDTVEVLHIVGVDRDVVADPEDFADTFMS